MAVESTREATAPESAGGGRRRIGLGPATSTGFMS